MGVSSEFGVGVACRLKAQSSKLKGQRLKEKGGICWDARRLGSCEARMLDDGYWILGTRGQKLVVGDPSSPRKRACPDAVFGGSI